MKKVFASQQTNSSFHYTVSSRKLHRYSHHFFFAHFSRHANNHQLSLTLYFHPSTHPMHIAASTILICMETFAIMIPWTNISNSIRKSNITDH